ncbi:MAG: hypothetical protein NTW94_03400 [Legionellales bacterium]|nr:hypothetical protein [Legionellales bacterium]
MKSLVLGTADLNTVFSTLHEDGLSTLEDFACFSCKLPWDDFQALVTKACKLRKLSIENNRDMVGELHGEPSHLLYLEKLLLSDCNITALNVLSLLKAAPNLVSLDLTTCGEVKGEILIEPHSLPYLAEIYLSRTQISTDSMCSLLKASTVLKSVNLSGCTLKDNPLFEPLPYLETLNLSRSSVTSSTLSTLIRAAQNIKTLQLTECQIPLGSEYPPPLHSLETLDLTGSSIEPSFFLRIMGQVPKLQVLKLSPNAFPTLEQMTLPCMKLSGMMLTTLLQSSPNLKILNLANTWISSIMTLAPGSLPELKQVVLPDSMEPRVLHGIIQALALAAPQLNLEQLRPKNSPGSRMPGPQPESGVLSLASSFSGGESAGGGGGGEVAPEPIHDHTKFKDFRPKTDPFEYKGDNASKDQKRIIQQLSQYYTLTSEHAALTLKIQDGICNPLSHYFMEHKELDGLLLRSTNAHPAWVIGLSDPILAGFTTQLLKQFAEQNPHDHEKQLQDSIADMPAMSRHELMTHLIQARHEVPSSEHLEALRDVIRDTPVIVSYDEVFNTWDKEAPQDATATAYYQRAVNGIIKKRLIECNSLRDADALSTQRRGK